jgi:tRNA (cmo5U34)-methyltransferase
MTSPTSSFSDPVAVLGYADRTARLVPGLKDLHRMVSLLLAEQAPADARILVLGAGGGVELRAFAEMHPNWRFDGVDPSSEMLQLARSTLGPMTSRVTFHEGYIHDAPEGPFDAACCLLTLHFLDEEERRKTVSAVHRRLKPGSPFVVAHHSFPNTGADKDKWLARYAAFSVASGMPAAQVKKGISSMKELLPVLSPDRDAAILRDCGFRDIELFYAGFTFRGWVGYRS